MHRLRPLLAALSVFLLTISCTSSSGPESPTVHRSGVSLPPPPVPPARSPAFVFYAAPDGNGDTCSFVSACSLSSVQQKVRSVNAQMTGDVVVYLRGGSYFLDKTMELGPNDSGTGDFYVMYRAYADETPVISGGRVVGGWTQVPGTVVWQARLNEDIRTRQLYVNGKRAVRARSDASVLGIVSKTTDGYAATGHEMQTWRNPDAIELVYTGFPDAGSAWTESRCGISHISDVGGGSAIHMKEPCWTNGTINKCCGQTIAMPTTVENAYELMNEPGEWYYDKSNTSFYYIPRPGEDLTQAEVIVPVLEVLVSGTGTDGNSIRNIHFMGITFAHATWLRSSGGDGFVEIQANVVLTGDPPREESLAANISFHHAQNLRFEGNRFLHLGAAGLAIHGGSQNNVVLGNVFTDISGAAIRIGDVTTPDPPTLLQDRRNWIVDNYIHDVAVEYHGGVGIMAGYAAELMIAHNEIYNVPYTALSLGWGWGTDSYARSNEVSYNHIYNYMLLLFDGGGIYTLSAQGEESGGWSSVHHNYIHDQGNNFGALYYDEGSAYIDSYNNVLAATPFWLFVWTSSIHDIAAHDNFSDTANYRNDGSRVALENNFVGSVWPDPAQKIIDSAGLEAKYQNIRRQ